MISLDARTEIIMHLPDRQVDLIKHLESSKQMWHLLKEHYKQLTNKTTKVLSFRYLVTLEMKEDNSLDAFISKYQSACDRAMPMGNKIDEEMKVDITFGALATSWGSFIVIHGLDPTLFLQNLISKMKQEDLRRRKPQNILDNPYMAMIVAMKYQRGNFKRNKF
mgnify:CR=1 FL=1